MMGRLIGPRLEDEGKTVLIGDLNFAVVTDICLS